MQLENPQTIDKRLHRIFNLLDNFAKGDFVYRETPSGNGDEIDLIIEKLNALGAQIQASGKLVSNYEERISAIMNVMLKYMLLDFSQKAEIGPTGDELDAIALALNTLGEELHEKIKTEEKHSIELERLAVLVETAADAVLSYTIEGNITQWNTSAERVFGFSASEIIGKSFLDNAPVEERDGLESMIRKAASGQQFINVHTQQLRKDKRRIDISLTMTPVFDTQHNVIEISALARDITEQKIAERILKESEERYRSLVEGVKDYAIITLDKNGYITSWNKGAESIKGYKADEALGKHFSIFYTDEDRENGLPAKLMTEATIKGKATHEGYRLIKGGGTFWGYVVITCLRDEQGRIIGYSKITRDLSESKRKDDQILKYTLRLEQKNLELERINKELASFAYVSSHDLQEPLRKIQTFAGRILDTDYENLSEAGRDYFNRMNSSANRMQRLILDILDYSRVSSAREKIEVADLTRLTEEVRDDFKEQLEDKKGKILIKGLCEVPVIPYQYKQLMSNLVGNALKFSRPGVPPVIKIEGRVDKYEFEGEQMVRHDKYCHVKVSDNGIGFEPHFSKQIFEVFQRLHTNDVYSGTGIGLAICKKIVENHHGHIEASGELNQGATFDIYFPLTTV